MTSNSFKLNSSSGKDGIVLQGYHKKLKTMKKKYFVLCAENGNTLARLEYYDSEKKFKSRSHPKRTIILRNCFNINRRLDTKYKYVIALSTKEEGFCIVLESEDELNKWLRALLALQRGEDAESEPPRPTFEHVWQVQIQRKGLADEKGIIGNYHVCLTSKSLTLVRIGPPTTNLGESRLYSVEFYLTTIRRCGDSQCYFYMEVGRHSAIGAGELWMETEDTLIAQNMHTMILNAMTSKTREDSFGPMRKRSSSANEASKPISVLQRRQTHAGNKPMNSSPLSESPTATSSTVSSTSTIIQAPIIKSTTSKTLEKSQSQSATNNSNISTTSQPNDLNDHRSALSASSCSTTRATPVITNTSCNPQYPFTAPLRPLGSQRRHSVSAVPPICHQRALSLPSGDPLITLNNSNMNNTMKCSNNIANQAAANTTNNNNNCSSNKGISHNILPFHQRTRSLPLAEEAALRNNQLNTQSSLKQINFMPNNTCSCNISPKQHQSSSNCSFHICCKGSSTCSLLTLSSNNNQNGTSNNSKTKINIGTNKYNEDNEMNNNNGVSCLEANSMESITEDPDIKSIRNFIIKNLNGRQTKIASAAQNSTKSSSNHSPSFLRRGRVISSRSTIMARERCDSLPTRNRTTSDCTNPSMNSVMMPPPRTIPTTANRPHSVYNNRHSHSPPMNTLSPSTGCSESDGSSLSIDETDSFGHSLTPDESGNFVSRYYNSRNSEGVIPEENCDDFWCPDNKRTQHDRHTPGMDKLNNHHGGLSLPILANQNAVRKCSPASNVGSVEMPGQYMEMYSPYSPCASSPCDQTGSGYMPISPGVEFPRALYTGSSGGHSRASSLAEETVDGYVPMCPPPPTQNYVDMEQNTKQQNLSELSSAASSCSITSGTPSTDIRFAEYPLDKVKSRFTPDDEDIQSNNERPIRAYSVGSRLEHNKRKYRTDRMDIITAEQNNSRVRAFSVGSRAKVPRCDLYRGVFTPNLMSTLTNNNNAEISTNTKSKKSSSAPILVHKSQSSVDRMSDLMEIDFSKNSEHTDSYSTPSPVRMTSFPVSVPSPRPVYEYYGSSPKTTSIAGYVEMKPGSLSDKASPSTSLKSTDNGYLEMKPVGLSKSPSLSSSPIKMISSPKSISLSNGSHSRPGDYINISPSSKSMPQYISGTNDRFNNFSSCKDKHMDVDNLSVMSSTPEGYMEMSWSKNSKVDNKSSNHHNISPETSPCENRSISRPIDIKGKDNNFTGLVLTETFPKKRHRNDSKECEVVTPSSAQPTIFPFSPGSPLKPFMQNDFATRKCLVDATSGTVTLSEDVHPNNNENDEQNDDNTKFIQETKILNTDMIAQIDCKKVEALTNDYADMSLGTHSEKKAKSKEKEVSDYVNYSPPIIQNKPETSLDKANIGNTGDYAVMKPCVTRKITASISSSHSTDINNSPQIYVPVAVAMSSQEKPKPFEGFKPISLSTDEFTGHNDPISKKTTSPKSLFISNSSRNLTNNNKCKRDDNSGYELLQMRSDSSLQTKKMSRPNSVNSDKISPLKGPGRPNSANSDCIPPISTSSSTSTLCGGSSSSSSTLCGSKSQSPLANSRPQSFSDSIVAPRPESVGSTTAAEQNIPSRPPSVSSERGLHYASLDLPPSTFVSNPDSTTSSIQDPNSGGNNNTTTLTKVNSSTSGESSSTSPSPNAGACQQQPTFTYAQIDFNKSENLKMAMNAASNVP